MPIITTTYPCSQCGRDTQLMYKFQEKDHPICVDCLMAELKAMIVHNYPNFLKEHPSNTLKLNEAIAIHLEFANIKIQHINQMMGEEDLNGIGDLYAVIVISSYNNAIQVHTFRPTTGNDLLMKAKTLLHKVFPNECYHEDLLPK